MLSPNMEGYMNMYYETGQLKSSVSRVNKVYAGLKIELHENGKLAGRGMYLGELEDGQQKGHWAYYYDNGQLKEIGSYQNNFGEDTRLEFSSKMGEWKYYDENGVLIKTENN
jgi:antitoxin component YwqK of YwqJK toxin-antitoxin module